MGLKQFLGLLSLLIGLMGSIFLVKGLIKITPDIMADLGTSKWGYNSTTLDNLAAQKADALVGFYLIIIVQTKKGIFSILKSGLFSFQVFNGLN